jgi:hypothetical protein
VRRRRRRRKRRRRTKTGWRSGLAEIVSGEGEEEGPEGACRVIKY